MSFWLDRFYDWQGAERKWWVKGRHFQPDMLDSENVGSSAVELAGKVVKVLGVCEKVISNEPFIKI